MSLVEVKRNRPAVPMGTLEPFGDEASNAKVVGSLITCRESLTGKFSRRKRSALRGQPRRANAFRTPGCACRGSVTFFGRCPSSTPRPGTKSANEGGEDASQEECVREWRWLFPIADAEASWAQQPSVQRGRRNSDSVCLENSPREDSNHTDEPRGWRLDLNSTVCPTASASNRSSRLT